MLPKVCIVGRPNVGKSTLFNRISNERISITSDIAGTTRDRIVNTCSWLNKEFILIDTGGITLKEHDFSKEIKMQVDIAISECDVIIFLCDIRSGVTDDDIIISRMLQKSKKHIILATSKVDNKSFSDLCYDFYSLGFGEPILVSAIHSIGIGNLLDKVVSFFSKVEYKDDKGLKFSLIGRPNVGKSSLCNAILNDQRSIVSNIAGTTRDSIDTSFEKDGKKYIICDTAGLKKRGKIYENIDKFSEIRTIDSIKRSDIVLLLIDASSGIKEQDTHIGQYVFEEKKPCIIVCNKWDLVTKETNTMKEFTEEIRKRFKYLQYAPIVFLSSLTKQRINSLFESIILIEKSCNRRIKTSLLNEVLSDSVAMNPPSEFNGGKAKFYYISQISVNPVVFLVNVNNESYIHFSYKRYLENQIRKNFDFFGSPISFSFRKRD